GTLAGRPLEQLKVNREALEILEKLDADYPGNPVYHDALASQGANLSGALIALDQFDEAEKVLGKALTVVEKLVAEYPDRFDYPRNQARNLFSLGQLKEKTGRFGEAEAAYRKALPIGRKLVTDLPRPPAFRLELVDYLCDLARLLV